MTHKSLNIIFFICLSVLTFAQEPMYELEYCRILENANFSKVLKDIDVFKQAHPRTSDNNCLVFYPSEESYRVYGFNIIEFSFNYHNIYTIDGITRMKESFETIILFDKVDSTIFYTKWQKNTYAKKPNPIDIIVLDIDTVKFEEYFSLHDSIFSTETERNYISPPFINKDLFFGQYCLKSIKYPTLEEYMLNLVKTKNSKELMEMIKAFNYETKAFGVSGLYFLKKNGYILSEEEEKLLLYGLSLNVDIITCNGDHFGKKMPSIYLFYEKKLNRDFEKYKSDKLI